MRYFERLDTWESKGPVYLFINEESRADETFLRTGLMSELAQETKGAMFLSEHRYYGESKPFVNITTENLRFLSSRQALADVAGLLKQIKSSPEFNSSKVVVVGGSYGGNLAAWMRLIVHLFWQKPISTRA
ncbi:Carboxypeptidase 3 [Operophtera brumata]|uniref:Carboxypeptidase 3 n=1 Tax=Operophtera brumata TaxID=104452 RepID=A0A0L7LI91_OPEBR|nr:Carboxypeptidase 3 [Operophtera brumata]